MGSRPQDRAEEERGPGSGQSEGSMIESMQMLKTSMDYTMILALISLSIMAIVLMLQGFRPYCSVRLSRTKYALS